MGDSLTSSTPRFSDLDDDRSWSAGGFMRVRWHWEPASPSSTSCSRRRRRGSRSSRWIIRWSSSAALLRTLAARGSADRRESQRVGAWRCVPVQTAGSPGRSSSSGPAPCPALERGRRRSTGRPTRRSTAARACARQRRSGFRCRHAVGRWITLLQCDPPPRLLRRSARGRAMTPLLQDFCSVWPAAPIAWSCAARSRCSRAPRRPVWRSRVPRRPHRRLCCVRALAAGRSAIAGAAAQRLPYGRCRPDCTGSRSGC